MAIHEHPVTTEAVVHTIAGTDLFADCDLASVGAIAGCVARTRTVAAGEVLCREGEIADQWWIVAEGTADVTIEAASSHRSERATRSARSHSCSTADGPHPIIEPIVGGGADGRSDRGHAGGPRRLPEEDPSPSPKSRVVASLALNKPLFVLL